jgi:hypothetical protein
MVAESRRTKSKRKEFDSEQSQAKRTDPMVIENNEEDAQPVVSPTKFTQVNQNRTTTSCQNIFSNLVVVAKICRINIIVDKLRKKIDREFNLRSKTIV